MHTSGTFPVRVDEHYQVVQMPYEGSNIVMDLIKPLDGDWDDFMEELTNDTLQAYLSDLNGQDVNLSLPKFKIETPRMNLIEPMRSLGLVDVFGANANLSGINGDDNLFLSTLVQKAYIDVNENGTEAAAVTIAVIMEEGSAMAPIEIRFDRPFLFVIRDTNTGTILFIGQLMQPEY